MMIVFLIVGTGLQASDALFKSSDLVVAEEKVSLVCGDSRREFILEVNGGGLVVQDFNLDGNLDLVTVNGSNVGRVRAGESALPSVLWLGDGEGGFRQAGREWDLAGGVWGMGGTAGDIDGDGDPDLVVTEWGRNRVFLNDQGRGFTAMATSDEEPSSTAWGEHWSSSCAFLDYDADGHLDLVVVNYLEFDLASASPAGGACRWKGHDVMCGPEGLVPVHDQLFRGNGDGTFVDVTEASGFRPEGACFGLGVMTLDYDRDGDTDVYVTNDSMPNHLWENQGDGQFKEVGWRRGVSHDSNGREQAGMGIGCADVDGDGRSDLFVTNFSGERNALYRSSKTKGYREKADVARLGGPSIQRLGWGTGMHDYDLDGFIDVSVINGHVYPAADLVGTDTSYAQLDQLFLGAKDQRFVEQPLSDGAAGVGRAAVSADFDGDGDLDLVAVHLDGPVRYLENQAQRVKGRHWLGVSLEATASHPDAIGAHVQVAIGELRYTGEVRTTAGYQAGCSTRLHFGLGGAEQADEIRIEWPSGHVQVLKDIAVDQLLVVQEEKP